MTEQRPVTFTASTEEVNLATEWRDRHVCPLEKDKRNLTWLFTPTGVGDALVVRCSGCRAEMDVTDYGRW